MKEAKLLIQKVGLILKFFYTKVEEQLQRFMILVTIYMYVQSNLSLVTFLDSKYGADEHVIRGRLPQAENVCVSPFFSLLFHTLYHLKSEKASSAESIWMSRKLLSYQAQKSN